MKISSLVSGSRKLLVGLALTVISMIIILSYSYSTSRRLNGNFEWVQHTYQVKEKISNLILMLTSQESRLRAYIITSDTSMIHNFEYGNQQLFTELDKLKKFIKDNPAQAQNVTRLTELFHVRVNLLYHSLSIKKTSPEGYLEILKSNALKGTATTKQILQIQQQMDMEEDRLLNGRHNEAFKTLSKNKISIIIATVFSLIVVFFTVILIDKEIKRRAEREKELADLDNNKNKFFSIISHDLRGPVHGISKLAAFLKDDSIDPKEVKEMSKMIENSCLKVGNLLENLLKWAQVQMGKIQYNPVMFDLAEVCNNSLQYLSLNAEIKNIKLVNRVVHQNVLADKDMVLTIIRNLVSNAIKFSHKSGEVIVEAFEDRDKAVVKIKDQGLGMSDEVKGRLFKMESMQSSKGTMNETGTGLGLLICKEFVEKNKGSIWVESTVNEGSEFYFTIPLAR